MTSQTGFHSTNATTITAPKPLPLLAPPTQPAPTTAITTNDSLTMYYCWTHGLGFNCTHTSATCSNLAEGHCPNATVKNMQGGNNTIMMSHYHHPKVKKAE